MMDLNQVSEHFEKEAPIYDDLILRLIPFYKEQHNIMLGLLPHRPEQTLSALDLGCGTGVLSYLLLSHFPNIRVTAYDLAENMLATCKKNLTGYSDRVTLKQGNFGTDSFGEGYDVVLSGFAIHHLDNPGKADLYKRIYRGLNPGGLFLNRDIVLGATPEITEQYHRLWRQFIRSNGEDDDKWFQNYLAEDIPASVRDQLDWLTDAGFADVGCHWKYLNFAIFGGRKP